MVSAMFAAAIAVATPQAVAHAALPAEDASPAMFVVRDADTTVYIFGTFHALDGRSEWFRDRVKAAFDDSGELVLETVIPDGPVRVRSQFRGPAVTPSASFLATTRMAISAGKSQGMQVGNGADNVLRHIAEAEGKPVSGLETLELQLSMFNRMPATKPAPEPKAVSIVPSALKRKHQVMVDLFSEAATVIVPSGSGSAADPVTWTCASSVPVTFDNAVVKPWTRPTSIGVLSMRRSIGSSEVEPLPVRSAVGIRPLASSDVDGFCWSLVSSVNACGV